MAVQFDESNFFKFVIISDNKPKPSKYNNFTEKPSKDKKDKEQKEQKDNNMSTTSSSSPPPNNEKLNEKKENSQEENKSPEIKVDDIPKSNGDSTKEPKEQKNENEEKSSRLTIDVPSKSTSPQYVTSPSDIRAKTPEPVSPSSNIFKNVGKKLGNMMKNSENSTTPEQEEVATSESEVQLQQEQQVVNNTVASDITKNTVDTARSIEDKKQDEDKKKDENKKDEDKKDEDIEDKNDEIKRSTSETTAAKQRTGSLPNLVNMKMFLTRSSSLFVDRLKKGFDNLDRKMYPDMEPEWVEENQSRETAISEREQLLENKDVEITNGKSQESQSTQSVMAEIGEALNERQERLNNLGEKTEELSSHATDFAALASQIRKNQEQKKSWFW